MLFETWRVIILEQLKVRTNGQPEKCPMSSLRVPCHSQPFVWKLHFTISLSISRANFLSAFTCARRLLGTVSFCYTGKSSVHVSVMIIIEQSRQTRDVRQLLSLACRPLDICTRLPYIAMNSFYRKTCFVSKSLSMDR